MNKKVILLIVVMLGAGAMFWFKGDLGVVQVICGMIPGDLC